MVAWYIRLDYIVFTLIKRERRKKKGGKGKREELFIWYICKVL